MKLSELLAKHAPKPHAEYFSERVHRSKDLKSVVDMMACLVAQREVHLRVGLVAGFAGVGKSYAAEDFQRMMRDEFPCSKSVLYVELSPSANAASILTDILHALGDPGTSKTKVSDLLKRLEMWVKDMDIQIIIIDEVQHCLPENTTFTIQRAADIFKSISDKTKIPIVLIGVPDIYRLLTVTKSRFKKGEQLRQRCDQTIFLHAPVFGQKKWLSMLDSYQDMISVPCINLSDDDVSKRLFVATRGYRRPISSILFNALQASDGKSQIVLTDLARAYARAESVPDYEDNPFVCDTRTLNTYLTAAMASRANEQKILDSLVRPKNSDDPINKRRGA